MKAIIMAGGEGARLRPLTCDKPKPMINIMGRPIMEYIIKLLKNYGITEIGVTLHYLPNEISDYFKDGENFGVNIEYFVEKDALGTAGGIKAAEKFLNEDFVVISGDILTDVDLIEALSFHRSQKSIGTILLSEVEDPIEYGVVTIDEDGLVKKFIERPDWRQVVSKNVNTEMYVFSPEILSYIPRDEFYDFGKDLFPKLVDEGAAIYGFETGSYWCDISDIDAYIACHNDIFCNKVDLSLSGLTERLNLSEFLNMSDQALLNKKLYFEKEVVIEEGAILEGPIYVENGTVIKRNARIGPCTVIGKNCTINSGSSIKRSIIWNNCILENNSETRGAVICSKVRVREGARIYENSVIGRETKIFEHAKIEPNVRVWPFKEVKTNTVVSQNLVWGHSESINVFSENKVMGEMNIDITPEFLTKIGSTFASVLGCGDIGIGYNCDEANDIVKGAISAGILASGLSVYDFGEQTLPITRNAVIFYNLAGAVQVDVFENYVQTDTKMFQIRFIDSKGSNVSREIEKKIELAFRTGDFVRCNVEKIKDVKKIENYKYYYLNSIIEKIRNVPISKNFEISANSPVVFELFDSIIDELSVTEQTNNSIFKAEISFDCESVLIWYKGKKMDEEQFAALVMHVVLKENPGANFVIPVNLSEAIKQMATDLGAKIIYSKTSRSDYVQTVLKEGTKLQFKMFFDGLYCVCYILKFLNENNTSVEEILDSFPYVYKKEHEIKCSNKIKKRLIFELASLYERNQLDLTDGIKIYTDDGWALIMPDESRDSCKVVIESFMQESLDELWNTFDEAIKNIARI